MTSPRTLLVAKNLRAKKKFGQHFLKDASVARRIVELAQVEDDEVVVEIGAGLGALTQALAEKSSKVIAVEKDPDLVGLLEEALEKAKITNVEVIGADILSMDLATLANPHGGMVTVAGNLPYNISSQVMVRLVQSRRFVRAAVLMFQKEVAERILSRPGRKSYGRLSVLVQYCADVEKLCELKAEDFFPRPKVDSAVLAVRFRPPAAPGAEDETFLFRMVQAAFGQRRKMLRNALAGSFLQISAESIDRALSGAKISGERRAETLSVEEFVRLANCLGAHENEKTAPVPA